MSENKVTVYTLAQELGVSVAAISRAFDPKSRLSREKREMILRTAEKYGYKPNRIASRLSMEPIHIGVLNCKLRQYSNANTIIVRGAFAEKYFNALDKDIKAGYSKQLYPPHPSMNQWGEYNKRAADFLTMRELFK